MAKGKRKHSLYCYYGNKCDKDINCIDGNFCDAYRTTDQFTTLDEPEIDLDYENQMDRIWEGEL